MGWLSTTRLSSNSDGGRPSFAPGLLGIMDGNSLHSLPFSADCQMWLWVKNRYPTWNSGRRKHGLKPAVQFLVV